MKFLRSNGARYRTYRVPTDRPLNYAFSQADGLTGVGAPGYNRIYEWRMRTTHPPPLVRITWLDTNRDSGR